MILYKHFYRNKRLLVRKYRVRTVFLYAQQYYFSHNNAAVVDKKLSHKVRRLHKWVDSDEYEICQGIRFERSLHIVDENLGVSGIVNMVEYDLHTGCLKLVEYKCCKLKLEPMDEIQIYAQALCLEDMTEQTIAGSRCYMQTRHRVPVAFSDGLRAQMLDVIAQVRELLASGKTPPPVYGKRCKACSLVEICQPKLLDRDWSVGYVAGLFGID